MGDYISREAAKEFFINMDAGSNRSYATLLAPEEFAEYLDEIPAANVEPVLRGNWNIRLADESTVDASPSSGAGTASIAGGMNTPCVCSTQSHMPTPEAIKARRCAWIWTGFAATGKKERSPSIRRR